MKKLYFRGSVLRNKIYQIKTQIVEENCEKYVIKQAVYPEGREHVERIYKNERLVEKIYSEENIIHGMFDGNTYITKFYKGEMLSDILQECLLSGDIKKYKDYLKIWKNLIIGYNNITEFICTKEFIKIFGNEGDELAGNPAVKIANIDCSSDNIIINSDGKIKIIDYEWVYDFPVPIDFIFYRGLKLFYSSYSVPYSWSELLKISNVDEKYIFIYDRFIDKFNDYVGYDQKRDICYSKLGNKFIVPVFESNNIVDKDIKYVFDVNQVPKMSKVIIYGAGNVGKSYCMFIKKTQCCELVAVCDKNAKLLRKQGLNVIDKSEINKYDFDYIIISVLRKEIADGIKDEISFINEKKVLWLEPILK